MMEGRPSIQHGHSESSLDVPSDRRRTYFALFAYFAHVSLCSGAAMELINGGRSVGLPQLLQVGFDGLNRIQGKEYISAHGANLSWNVVEDDYFAVVFDHVGDLSLLVFSRAGLDRAWLHVRFPLVGRSVVHTTCNGLPPDVDPHTRQQAPRRWSGQFSMIVQPSRQESGSAMETSSSSISC